MKVCHELELSFGDGISEEFCAACGMCEDAPRTFIEEPLCERCGERPGVIYIDPRGDGHGICRCEQCVEPLRDLTEAWKVPGVIGEPHHECPLCGKPAQASDIVCAGCEAALIEALQKPAVLGLDGEFHPSLFDDRRF